MDFYKTVSLKTYYLVVLGLVVAFSANSFGAIGPQEERILGEISSGSHLPRWFPKDSRLPLVQGLKTTVFSDTPFSSEQNHKEIPGRFSKFFISNSSSYSDICFKALSVGECKERIWEKTKKLLVEKTHIATVDAVNRLLFLKNNPHLSELEINFDRTAASFGLNKKQTLGKFLEPYFDELNLGGYRTSLFNSHEEYKEAKGLFGPMSPKEMGELILGKDSGKHLTKKFSKARAVFEMEWKLFYNNVLFPHTLFVSLQKSVERAMFLTPTQARPKVVSLSMGMCESLPATLENTPELVVYCQYLHQNK